MWVERFGLCVGSNVRFAGVFVSPAPHQVRGDGKRARQSSLPHRPAPVLTINPVK